VAVIASLEGAMFERETTDILDKPGREVNPVIVGARVAPSQRGQI